MQKRNATEVVVLATALLTAVAGLAGALKDVAAKLKGLPDAITPLTVLWIAICLGGSLLFSRLTRARSRVLRQEAFRIHDEQRDHLKGRDDDITRLASFCVNQPQVHLIGESGAGKSALVHTGVLPRLESMGVVAVAITHWGRDWIDGPAQALRQAMSMVPAIGGPVDVATAAQICDDRGKRLLIVFDQFDDYQSAHYECFRTAERAFIKPRDLMAQNSFWKEIGGLIAGEKIHALFVTRNDAAAGLECVRFVEPDVCLLDRLPVEAAHELIDTLTSPSDGKPVIADAENGWPSLRARLERDLCAEGSVLPIQMKLALIGVSHLRYLTVREYERRGGLAGLAAEELTRHIAAAASHHELDERQVLAIARDMVEGEGRKTRTRTLDDFVGASGASAVTVAAVLDDWVGKELVRVRIDADTGGRSWSLDHDYLATGVLAAEARFDSGRKALDDGESDFRASGGNAWRRWRTLLSPSEQFRLLGLRLRGRVQYRGRRAYVAWSLLRFAPYVMGIAIAVIGAERFLSVTIERDASNWLGAIGSEGYELTRDETATLTQVRGASKTMRVAFIDYALRSPLGAKRLLLKIEPIMKAAVADDPTARLEIAEHLHQTLATTGDKDVQDAAASGLAELHAVDFQTLLRALHQKDNEDMPRYLLTRMSDHEWATLLGSDVVEHINQLVSAATKVKRYRSLLPQRFYGGRARETDLPVENIVHQADFDTFMNEARLPQSQSDSNVRAWMADEFRRRVPSSPNWNGPFLSLAQKYGVSLPSAKTTQLRTDALAFVKLDPSTIQSPPDVTFTEAASIVDQAQFVFLGSCPNVLNAMNPSDVAKIWQRIVAKEPACDAETYVLFRSDLTAPVAQALHQDLLQLRARCISSSNLGILCAVEAKNVKPDDRAPLIDALVAKGKVVPMYAPHTEGAFELANAVEKIHELGGVGKAGALADRLRQRIVDEFRDADFDVSVGPAVVACAPYFTEEEKQQIKDRATQLLPNNPHTSKLAPLVAALIAVGDDSWMSNPAIIARLKKGPDESLARVLKPVAGKLPPDLAQEIQKRLTP